MRCNIFSSRLLTTLLFSLVFQLVTLTAFAQYTKLYDFGNTDNGTHPFASLATDGTFLYGTTSDGGANNFGTIYKVKPDGTGFIKLLDFDGSNGQNPYGSLHFQGSTLYGMTFAGGAEGHGTIFKINPDGTAFATLHDFLYNTSGAFPFGSLISDGTFLYGMTSQGGTSFNGTMFKIKLDGSGFLKLLDFDRTNSGANPFGSLISVAGFLYGMTNAGGVNDLGAIVKIATDGTGFTKLLDFNGANTGSNPYGTLISDGTFLYGTTIFGGTNNVGTIFKIMPDGSGFTKLLNFSNGSSGTYPKGSLFFDGTSLFGTTTQGGANASGTIFKILPNGSGFVNMQDLTGYSFGPRPEGRLILLGATLYGVRSAGGTANYGGIMKINTNGTGYANIFSFETAGASPGGTLISDGTFFYGMNSAYGAHNDGTIFKIKGDGTGFTKLLDFDAPVTGGRPTGSLVSDGTFLYGMTGQGGTNNAGTLFKILPDGSGFVILIDFDYNTTGGSPNGTLMLNSGFLFGMTAHGSPDFNGTVFKIKTDGTGFQQLVDFDYTDGAYPDGSLISDGTFLYGMTYQGGDPGFGVIFKVKPDGTGFAKLHDFDNNAEGGNPHGDLLLNGSFLYGMTSSGGLNNAGSVFKIKTDGTGYVTMMYFGNDNGAQPNGSFLSDGTFLYGMTSGGGVLGQGTMFKIKPDGTGYSKMLDFNDGAYPAGSLLSDGTFLYGLTGSGGAYNLGTMFKRSIAPYTTITNFDPSESVEGTLVTINGTDFNPIAANNIVKFNNIPSTVITSSESTITVFVPVGATTGPITVDAGGTPATSLSDFVVTDENIMFNGTVKSCDVDFTDSGGSGDIIQTFLPVNPQDKIKVSFSSFDSNEALFVYDGPTTASPLIATLTGLNIPADIVSTSPGGELTFHYEWQDGTTNWDATISCQPGVAGNPPVITPTVAAAIVGGTLNIDVGDLVSDPDNNLDLSTLELVSQPTSGAPAVLEGTSLSINYAGFPTATTDTFTISVCDLTGLCATQEITIEFAGDITVYNAISPNGDSKNEYLFIQYIDVLPTKQQNQVRIYSRWGDEVFSISNYDNHNRVFKGSANDGTKLPAGTYFYKISFASGEKGKSGFLELKY